MPTVFPEVVSGRGGSGDFLRFVFKRCFIGVVAEREVVDVMDPQG